MAKRYEVDHQTCCYPGFSVWEFDSEDGEKRFIAETNDRELAEFIAKAMRKENEEKS